MTGTGINTVRIGDEVKHITDLDALTLMHEWSKLKKENADLYGYNRQVNRGWRGFILRLMGIHLPEKNVFVFMALMPEKNPSIPTEAVLAVIVSRPLQKNSYNLTLSG